LSSKAGLIQLDFQQSSEYFKVVRAVLTHIAPNGEWSEGAVCEQLDSKLRSLRALGRTATRDEIEKEGNDILTALQPAPVDWSVYFRVDGLYEECLPLTIGNATFFPTTTSLAERVMRHEATPPSDREPSLDDLVYCHARKEIEEEFGTRQWAVARVIAAESDTEAARDLAHEYLRLTLDVMNFYADIWRPGAYRARVTFGYEPQLEPMRTAAHVGESEPSGVSMTVMGPFDNVWLPPPNSADACKLGLDRVSAILAKWPSDASEVDRRVVAALRWAGRATVAPRLDEALLLYLIALEGLIMGPQKSESIVYKLARRVAHTFDDTTNRKEVVEEVEYLYNLRSRLVHTGTAHIGESDVNRARFISKEVAVKVLSGSVFAQMRKNSDLDGWFESKMLGES
jgi:hypothetical protein